MLTADQEICTSILARFKRWEWKALPHNRRIPKHIYVHNCEITIKGFGSTLNDYREFFGWVYSFCNQGRLSIFNSLVSSSISKRDRWG
jgi:hypothetical protein